MTASFDRRALLRTTAVALGGAGVGWAGGAAVGATGDRTADGAGGAGGAAGGNEEITVLSPTDGEQTEPFIGPHQAGIETPAQAHLSLLGLDLRDGVGRSGLARLMRLLSDDAARLTQGRPALADTEGELAQEPSRLTVTFGFGPRVVEDLLPAGNRPALAALPSFSTDRLRPRWGQTDLAVQICGDDQTTIAHARRMLLKDAEDFAQVRWVQNGFRRARGSQPDGTTMRNVMGQVDGTVNPVPSDSDYKDLVWATSPPAFEGGTMMVVRRIRAEMKSWDRTDRTAREFSVGRTLDTGAPLGGEKEFDEPDFEATNELGFPVIDTAAHIRRARSDDPRERFARRVFNYTELQPNGEEDSGLVFIAFAADLDRQFVPIQQRLADQDRLNEWITTIGSAVYAIPPGVTEGQSVGESLVGAP